MQLPKTQKGLSKSKEFYVYVHKRRSDGSVFYVGKGHGRRAWMHKRRSEYWHNVVNKYGLEVELVMFGIQEWFAFEFEKDLIAYYGRDVLCNFTDGGEGSCGATMSEETRRKMSESSKGKRLSESHVAILRAKKLTDAQKAAVSRAQKGRVRSAAEREAVSKRLKGKKLPPEHVAKIAAYRRGKPLSPETRRKIGDRLRISKGKPVLCSNGMIFISAVAAADWLRTVGKPNANNTAIAACCRGDRKRAYGFEWSHAAIAEDSKRFVQ